MQIKQGLFYVTLFASSIMISTLARADAPVIDAYQYDTNNAAQTPQNNSSNDSSNSVNTDNSQAQAEQQDDSSSSSMTIKQRVAKLERQMANQNQVDTPQQINNLQQQVQDLRGRLEVQDHDIKMLRQQMQTMYQDLDSRLANNTNPTKTNAPAASGITKSDNSNKNTTKQVTANNPDTDNSDAAVVANATQTTSSSSNANPTKSTPAANNNTYNAINNAMVPNNNSSATTQNNTQNSSNSLKEQDFYTAGYNAIKNRDYPNAITNMQNYLQKYPNGQYASNAHYWLGELYLLDNQSANAITEFQTVITKYPTDTKVPDAKLKLGFIYYDDGNMAKAKQQLTSVKKEYPGTTVAKMAEQRLKEM